MDDDEETSPQASVEQLATGPYHVPPASTQRAQLQKIQLLEEVQQPPTPS